MSQKSLAAVVSAAILLAGPGPLTVTAAAQTMARGTAASVSVIPTIETGLNSPVPGASSFNRTSLLPDGLTSPALAAAPSVAAPVPVPPAELASAPKSEGLSSALDVARELAGPQGPQWNGRDFDGSSPARVAAREELYRISGGDPKGGDPRKASLTTAERTEYFQSRTFRNWVAAEKQAGRRVFWLKDLDKTQARGDIFTFFFQWRAQNDKFTPQQNEILKAFLRTVSVQDEGLRAELTRADANDAKTNAALIIKLWRSKEEGGEGIDLIEFWRGAYWPTQKGLTRQEKLAQVKAFAPHFASNIYSGVKEENLALKHAGVDVVIVSNGDQELARAVAPLLGIKLSNVVGSHLVYEKVDGKSLSTGVNHAYEIFDKEWHTKPQPGKSLSFHYWLNANKWRWGWEHLDLGRVVVAGADGDSASSDGGMMMLLPSGSALGNFMVDTPAEPGRLKKFHTLAEKYGWTKGEFLSLIQDPAFPGAWTDKD